MVTQRHRLPILLSALFFVVLAPAQATDDSTRGLRPSSKGRVAGLAISVVSQVPNGDGKDVTFQVDMTTVRSNRTGDGTVRPRGGPGEDLFSPGEFSISSSGFGGLGDAMLNYRMQASTSPTGRSFSGFYYNSAFNSPRLLSGGFYAGNFTYYMARDYSFVEGELPALDFGDSATIDVTSLTLASGPTTSTDSGISRATRRWRGIFVHTYADQGGYTVVAASRCCPARGILSDDDDTLMRGAGGLYTGTIVFPENPSSQSWRRSSSYVFRFSNATETPGPTFGSVRGQEGPDSPGAFSGDFSSGSGSAFTGYPQVVNSVAVPPGSGLLAVPTAGSTGLALLSLVLAALGVLFLRR